jgi:hypothetical protein
VNHQQEKRIMRRSVSRSAQTPARLLIFVLALGCLQPSAPQSYGFGGGERHSPQGKPPRFEDFPVPKIFRGKPARPLLSTPDARAFRTHLREGAKEGPNFAGHYTIVGWGCGTGCEHFAIIDAQTGRVYFSDTLSTATYNLVENIEEAGLKYRLDSKLLILVGSPGEAAEAENMVGTFYYKWENNRLTLIHSVKKQPAPR